MNLCVSLCTVDMIYNLFTWRWGIPGKWGSMPNLYSKSSPCLSKIVQPWDPMVKFLEVVLANVTWTWSKLRGLPHLERFMWQKLRPSLTGLPCHAADQATHLGRLHQLSCNNDQDKIRDYMERQVTLSRQVTTPMLRSSPPCRQALRVCNDQWVCLLFSKYLQSWWSNCMIIGPFMVCYWFLSNDKCPSKRFWNWTNL